MDLKEYYRDLHITEAQLQKQFPEGIVHVTSIYHRERNSKPGQTLSGGWNNAARVLTDGTHRLSKPREIKVFMDRQEQNRAKALRDEQSKKQQYIVVVDPNNPSQALPRTLAQATFTPGPSPVVDVMDDDEDLENQEDESND